MTENTRLKAALDYAARGWLVFPLAPNDKAPLAPLVPHGVKDATKDAAKIRDWWTRQPDANVAIACGVGDCGPYVVDVDAPHGGHKHDGAASLSAAGFAPADIVVPAGEDTKSVEVAAEIWSAMAQLSFKKINAKQINRFVWHY